MATRFSQMTIIAAAITALFTHAAHAATLQAQVNYSDGFLIANGLQTAAISLAGFSDGQSVQGISGTFEFPWTVTTTGQGFFNVTPGAGPEWSGGGYDSGFLPSDGTSPFGTPGGNIIFGSPAAFAITGANTIHPEMSWLSAAPNGVPVNSSTTIPLLRLTWSASHSATVSFLLVMNTPGETTPMSITIPAVPAPGALPLFVCACGRRGRRH